MTNEIVDVNGAITGLLARLSADATETSLRAVERACVNMDGMLPHTRANAALCMAATIFSAAAEHLAATWLDSFSRMPGYTPPEELPAAVCMGGSDDGRGAGDA